MKPRIFISHSCKDLESGAAGPAEPEAAARRTRLEFARAVREKVVKRLEPRFEILLDRKLLEPGDEWRAKLHRWLDVCDGAVILLNREAVASDWVRKEATILTWRQDLGRLKAPAGAGHAVRPRIVSAFLGDFGSAELRRQGFGPLRLLETQAARIPSKGMTAKDAADLTREIVRGFDNFPRKRAKTPMSEWLRKVERILRKVEKEDEELLDDARRELGVGDQAWGELAAGDRTPTLAHQLLHSPLDRIYAALRHIKDGLDPGQFKRLVAMLKPVWVHAAAARQLLEAPLAKGRPRILAINGRFQNTGRAYVERAYCCKVDSWKILTAPEKAGEKPVKELMRKFQRSLSKQLRLTRHGPKFLKRYLNRAEFFMVLGPSAARADLLKKLAGTWDRVTYLLLAGDSFSALPRKPRTTLVQPELARGVERQAEVAQKDLENLAG